MKILSQIIPFVFSTVKEFRIDESHAVGHAFDVLHHAHVNWKSSLESYPHLEDQQNVIYTSALVHDLCDAKYVDPGKGLAKIQYYLAGQTELSPVEIGAVSSIITTMSYSKVQKKGFPTLGAYQYAYHIVREGDLLAAYSPDRSILYNMYCVDPQWKQACKNAHNLMRNRVWKHGDDKLFLTPYGKTLYKEYEAESRRRMDVWLQILHDSTIITGTSGVDLHKTGYMYSAVDTGGGGTDGTGGGTVDETGT